MSLCILAGGKVTVIAATAFSLSWIHSVEKIEWQEDWAIVDAEFVLTEARVKGSGAGMDPGAPPAPGCAHLLVNALPVDPLLGLAAGRTPAQVSLQLCFR